MFLQTLSYIMYELDRQITKKEVSEIELYEDLSQFIKIFKKIMSHIQTIVGIMQKQQDCYYAIKALKQILAQNTKLITSYHFQMEDKCIHKNTYYRFICRLIENTAAYKNRTFSLHPISAIHSQLLSNIDNCINSYKVDKNIGKIFKRIFKLTCVFCNNCQIIVKNGNYTQHSQLYPTKEIEETNEIQQKLEVETKKLFFHHSESNFHKAMGGLSRRFLSLSCLDIDYNSFKSSFFQSKNDNGQLYQQIYGRNHYILRQINNYSKQFQEYMKRRKEKQQLTRKNRFKDSKILSNTFYMSSKIKTDTNAITENSEIYEIEQKYRIQNDDVSKSRQFPLISENSFKSQYRQTTQKTKISFQETKSKDFDRRKTSYQINQVYLTINKIPTNQELKAAYAAKEKSIITKKKYYNIIKMNKYSLRSTKFVEKDQREQRPLLQIKQCDYLNFGNNSGQTLLEQLSNITPMSQQGRIYNLQKNIQNKKLILSDKKNIRITQLLTKTMNTSSIINNEHEQGQELNRQ